MNEILSSQTTPPPLPQPGTSAGQEEIPAPPRPIEPDATGYDRDDVDACEEGSGRPVRTYLIFMAFFTLIWLVSGGGNFWPVWPMLGWGLGLVLSGHIPLPGDQRALRRR